MAQGQKFITQAILLCFVIVHQPANAVSRTNTDYEQSIVFPCEPEATCSVSNTNMNEDSEGFIGMPNSNSRHKDSPNLQKMKLQDGSHRDLTLSNATKFRVCDKMPEIYSSKKMKPGKNIIPQLKAYEKHNCTEFLQGSKFSRRSYAASNNGFVNTVVKCYNKHHNLVIRPDDIWTAIMTQFSFYINANSEEFRKQFVNFEGKKTLSIGLPGTLRTAPYDLFIKLMTEKIDENILDKEIKNWILPNFSTTTQDDIITSGAIFMATMKNYFNYRAFLFCGIPWITLKGTVEDWQEILRRSEKLKTYKLEKWYNMLQPILKKFVEAKQKNFDVNFYQRICHYHPGGSGPDHISGWITAFCVFDIDGKWVADEVTEKDPWPRISTEKIPPGIVQANVEIIDMDGTKYDSVLFAGHMAFKVLKDNTTLKPETGWGLALKASSRKTES